MTESVTTTKMTTAEDSESTLNAIRAEVGFIPNVYGVFARVPSAFKGLMSLNAAFEETSFSAAEREIVALTTSVYNRCPYCVAGHSTFALQQGVDAETVDAVRSGGFSLDPREQALGRTTLAMLQRKGQLSTADTITFLNAGYSCSQLLELLLGIAAKTMTNFASKIAKIPLDEAFLDQAWTPLGEKADSN
ncbi:carboxymuconolactone decarboxylase family protein [Hyphomonas sp.]|uniref:carboxymuconolactone decarboxylase family protein n=1 Tax=Hyphomonas sp. TaxID=87 RepID=UPI003D26F1E0